MIDVLLVGSGGREHALAWKIAQSPLLGRLFIAPGNPGTAQIGQNVPISLGAIAELVDFAKREGVGLVVVGPEAPLAAGLADAYAAAGIPVFGPRAAAAQIEASKAFAKQIMQQAGVPTAAAHTFDDPAAARAFVEQSGVAWVVKADGLASGKGVIVADDVAGTLAAIAQLGQLGAGSRLLLEEQLSGPEVSLIALCDGERVLALPLAQDHKRLNDGNHGPNTGGMGAYAPAPHLDAAMIAQLTETVLLPTVRTLAAAGTPFCGALYAGLMLTPHGPKVLEFNARFGDPETQAIMPMLDGDLLAALLACANGQLEPGMLGVKAGAAACVVLAAAGYPDAPRAGDVINGLAAAAPDTLVFHAGTATRAGEIVTAGGRVLGVTGLGATLDAALERAYAGVAQITFEGAHYRHDIGRT